MRIRREIDPVSGARRLIVQEGEIALLVEVSRDTARDAVAIAAELCRQWCHMSAPRTGEPIDADTRAADMLRTTAAGIDGRDFEEMLDDSRREVAMLRSLARACDVEVTP